MRHAGSPKAVVKELVRLRGRAEWLTALSLVFAMRQRRLESDVRCQGALLKCLRWLQGLHLLSNLHLEALRGSSVALNSAISACERLAFKIF